MRKKILASTIVILIIGHAQFKTFTIKWYSYLLDDFLESLNIKGEALVLLNKTSRQDYWREDVLGWLIHYPFYFLLHISLIMVIFRGSARKLVAATVLGFMVLLIIGIIVSSLLEANSIKIILFDLMSKLIGLPFILLAIEGGRILINDIDKHSN